MQSVNQGTSGAMTDWKAMGADKKIAAGLCGILLGWAGVHKFILGYTNEGIIQLVIGLVTCGAGGIIGLIEGIIYLTKSDEEFVRTYIQNKKGWF
jgi:TM2 domain-containing membrane protein YozV